MPTIPDIVVSRSLVNPEIPGTYTPKMEALKDCDMISLGFPA